MPTKPISTEPVSYYPVLLDLRGRSAVVVGGGAVAVGKVAGLLAAGAEVTVIAPELSPLLRQWASTARIGWTPRAYRHGDLIETFIAVAATDSPEVNRRVWEEAEQRRVPLNAVDDPPHCSFILPAIHRDGELLIAVSSGGSAPALAVRIRDRIARMLGTGYGPFLQLLGDLRGTVLRRHPTFEKRKDLWYRIVDSQVLELSRGGDGEGARRVLLDLIEAG